MCGDRHLFSLLKGIDIMLVLLMISPGIPGFFHSRTNLQYLLYFCSSRSLLRISLKKKIKALQIDMGGEYKTIDAISQWQWYNIATVRVPIRINKMVVRNENTGTLLNLA